MKNKFDYSELSRISQKLKERGLYLAIYEDGNYAELEPGTGLIGDNLAPLLATLDYPLSPEQMKDFIAFVQANPMHGVALGQIRFTSM